MLVEINDRLYNEFVSWAQANNMNDNDMHKYIEKAFRDKFTIDKYGDLNEKLTTKEEPPKTKKKTEPKFSGPTKEPINEPINEDVNEGVTEDVNGEVKPNPPKRKTRVIASK